MFRIERLETQYWKCLYNLLLNKDGIQFLVDLRVEPGEEQDMVKQVKVDALL